MTPDNEMPDSSGIKIETHAFSTEEMVVLSRQPLLLMASESQSTGLQVEGSPVMSPIEQDRPESPRSEDRQVMESSGPTLAIVIRYTCLLLFSFLLLLVSYYLFG